MFTGIVQVMGRIEAMEKRDFGVRLRIERAGWNPGPIRPGDSVAVSGVCLTVVEATDAALGFDVVPQTLSATTLGDRKVGDRVNLEPSLVVGQAVGGHFVQGHVDGIATVERVTAGSDGHRITFTTQRPLMAYVVPRGSVTLDGVSMTLAEVDDETFTVAVIPTTLAVTTLGLLRAGDRTNVETDILARTIVHRLQMQGGGTEGVDAQLLRAAGFMG